MITVVIEYNDNTLVAELPKGNIDLQVELQKNGIKIPINKITLFGNEAQGIEVQLASSDRVSQHLCSLVTEGHTLADVNTIAWLIKTLDPAIKPEIDDNIYQDRYETLSELVGAVKQQMAEQNNGQEVGMGGI